MPHWSGTAELEHAVVMIVQVQIVVALQHLVAEFSEGDALFGIQATGDDVLEIIVPTRKFLPMSRRKSNTFIVAVQS